MATGEENLVRQKQRLSVLTRREIEVLERTVKGETNAQVATALGISVHGVKFHLASVFRKLSVRNRTEAAAVYLRQIQGR